MTAKKQSAKTSAPLEIVNKTYLAGLGLVSQTREQFEHKFVEFAKDGEKVRKDVEKSVAGLRKQMEARVESTRQRIANGIESTLTRVLEVTPVATTEDIARLNTKIDQILVRVAK